MSAVWWFLAGLAVLPLILGAAWLAAEIRKWLRWWYTRPVDLKGKTLAYRRSLIVGLTLELLNARHAYGIRLPFNRIIVIRSNPRREYDFLANRGQNWVVIGGDFDNARSLIGDALDKLGYAVEADQ